MIDRLRVCCPCLGCAWRGGTNNFRTLGGPTNAYVGVPVCSPPRRTCFPRDGSNIIYRQDCIIVFWRWFVSYQILDNKCCHEYSKDLQDVYCKGGSTFSSGFIFGFDSEARFYGVPSKRSKSGQLPPSPRTGRPIDISSPACGERAKKGC